MNTETTTYTSRRRRFTPALERDFRASNEGADSRQNLFVLLIVLPLYALYALVDAITLAHPREAVAIRLGFALLAAAPAIAISLAGLTRRHDLLTAASVMVMGLGVNVLIWRDPSLDHNYYVALIQGGIFVSFLARLTFAQSVCVLLTFLAGFAVAVFDKEPTDQAVLQVFILITMFSMCAFGIHLFQALRRRDFLKSKTIAEQNKKLNEMLADVQLDNARKVAAMNLLVHFVKTPIHQIVGFSDVIRGQIDGINSDAREGCLESAAFIQSASRDLSRNVARLLAYYRLDEKAAAAPDLVELDALLIDHLDRLAAPPSAKGFAKVAIVNRRELVSDAVAAMIDRYVEAGEAGALVGVRLERQEQAAVIVFTDDGPALGAEEFARQVRPLDKLDHYLTANGSSMQLGLRTVARATELCGGALGYAFDEGRNVFFLRFADLAAQQAMGGVNAEPAAA